MRVVVRRGAAGTPGPALSVVHEDSPAGSTSLLPQVTLLHDGRVAASWLEPTDGGGYTFRMAIRDGRAWSTGR